MKKTMLAILVTVAFSAVGVLGDYFLKLSSARDQPLRTRWFYIGFAVYASTAFGWVFVMRHLKLATIGVVYSISMVLLLTAVGVVLFGESLNYYELAGIALAVASLVLLMRFASNRVWLRLRKLRSLRSGSALPYKTRASPIYLDCA
jgi:small multidrug resistance pump